MNFYFLEFKLHKIRLLYSFIIIWRKKQMLFLINIVYDEDHQKIIVLTNDSRKKISYIIHTF